MWHQWEQECQWYDRYRAKCGESTSMRIRDVQFEKNFIKSLSDGHAARCHMLQLHHCEEARDRAIKSFANHEAWSTSEGQSFCCKDMGVIKEILCRWVHSERRHIENRRQGQGKAKARPRPRQGEGCLSSFGGPGVGGNRAVLRTEMQRGMSNSHDVERTL